MRSFLPGQVDPFRFWLCCSVGGDLRTFPGERRLWLLDEAVPDCHVPQSTGDRTFFGGIEDLVSEERERLLPLFSEDAFDGIRLAD